jgi:cell wall-associated NlpC family hydrolase
MRSLGTLGTFLFFLIAYVVGGTNEAIAQQKMVQTFRTHVTADEEVWEIAPPAALAEAVVMRLGRQLRWAGLDCSHLVHDIYERAGFPYDYATSRDLYDGVDAFRRVRVPLPGDIIVWRGHVGIVIDPDSHSFLSALRSGVKVSAYDTHYWKMRGQPRFYRYSVEGGGAPDWSQASLNSRASIDRGD